MDILLQYVLSPEFSLFLQRQIVPVILASMLVAFVALLLEMRLPIKYYWSLPGHGLVSLLRGLHILRPVPVWGVCTVEGSKKVLPLVAVELLDETSKKVAMRTYSNHAGEYGFALKPGKYLLRAVKNHYKMPTLLDPENIEIIEVDESFAISVFVINEETAPSVNLAMVPTSKVALRTGGGLFWHYSRMGLFQLANGLLVLNVILALAGYFVTTDPFYGLILAVAVVLLFIKLYILETIRQVTEVHHA